MTTSDWRIAAATRGAGQLHSRCFLFTEDVHARSTQEGTQGTFSASNKNDLSTARLFQLDTANMLCRIMFQSVALNIRLTCIAIHSEFDNDVAKFNSSAIHVLVKTTDSVWENVQNANYYCYALLVNNVHEELSLSPLYVHGHFML